MLIIRSISKGCSSRGFINNSTFTAIEIVVDVTAVAIIVRLATVVIGKVVERQWRQH